MRGDAGIKKRENKPHLVMMIIMTTPSSIATFMTDTKGRFIIGRYITHLRVQMGRKTLVQTHVGEYLKLFFH